MNADRYLEFKRLRDKYDDQLVNKEVGAVQVEKNDLLDLLQAALERGAVEVQFNGKLTKLVPKEKTDGDLIEVTFTTIFGAEFLGHIGQLFGRSCHIVLEPITLAESKAAEDEAKGEAGDLEGQLGLFDGPTADPAPDEIHQAGVTSISSTCPACGGTCYRGEGSEEACETCGGSGVVHTESTHLVPRAVCPTCDGACNIPDPVDGFLGPCPTCHGSGSVEGEAEESSIADQDEEEVDADLENEARYIMSEEDGDDTQDDLDNQESA